MKRLFVLICAVIFISCTPTVKVEYQYNDGPLLTWEDATDTTVTINWLTSETKESSLVWGTSKTDMKNTEKTLLAKMHHVTLKNLEAGKTYYYKINEDLFLADEKLIPEDGIFTYTVPNPAEPLDFVIIGDMQSYNEETLRTNRIAAKKIAELKKDCIIQLGDLTEVGTSAESWHWFMKSAPIGGCESPFLAAVGNHDYYWEIPNASNFKATLKYNYPSQAISKSAYYTVDIKNAHLVFLDNFDLWPVMTPSQKKWIENDLKEAAAKSDWIFVFMHLPPFTTSNERDHAFLHEWLIPLCAEYSVDAIFWAHMHLYEHYEYQYGKNGYVFSSNDQPAKYPLHMFCSGGGGARLDSLYGGFTDHDPFDEKMTLWNTKEEKYETKKFEKRPWDADTFREDIANKDTTTQDWTKEGFEMAKVFYYYPFESKTDYENNKYSADKKKLYCDNSEFLGFKYGENVLHYIRIQAEKSECTMSVHYYNGNKGEHGDIMETPDGSQQKWTLTKKSR